MAEPLTRSEPELADRLAARLRPDGPHVMHQSWDHVLFLHWPVPVEVIRPLIPEPIQIDTFDGQAWVSITPLYIYDAGPAYVPAVPFLSHFNELNVRTYVHVDRVPGVWFFSLDAASMLAVMGARTLFRLPYFHAQMTLDRQDGGYVADARRADESAHFNASWITEEPAANVEPDTLDFFLIERYCLYTAGSGHIYRSRINHEYWPVRGATLRSFESNMHTVNGLPEPETEPLVHAGGPVHVDVWPLERVADTTAVK